MNEILKNNGIKYGIIIGVLGILFHLIVYLIGGINDKNTLIASLIQLVSWLAFLITRIIQCRTTKNQMNSVISFKEVFTTLTISVSIGIVISQLFVYLLNSFIDVDYGNMMNKFANDKQIEISKKMRSFIEVTSSELKEMAKTNNFSFINIIKGTFATILLSSILNLILAAIFKSRSNSPFNE